MISQPVKGFSKCSILAKLSHAKNVPNCVMAFLDEDVVFFPMICNAQELVSGTDQLKREPLDIRYLDHRANLRIFNYVRSTKGCHGCLSDRSFAAFLKKSRRE